MSKTRKEQLDFSLHFRDQEFVFFMKTRKDSDRGATLKVGELTSDSKWGGGGGGRKHFFSVTLSNF